MNKNNFKNRLKPGDYPVRCDTCGQQCWYSQSKVLDPYTGLGDALVCPNCQDGIYWDSVPYKVEAEENVPVVRANPDEAHPEDIQDTSDPANIDWLRVASYNKPNDEIP